MEQVVARREFALAVVTVVVLSIPVVTIFAGVCGLAVFTDYTITHFPNLASVSLVSEILANLVVCQPKDSDLRSTYSPPNY